MFKKAGDNVHFLDRTGSHSTKGSRRGVDHMAPMTSEDFNSEQNIKLRRREIRKLRRSIAADIQQAAAVKVVLNEAAETGNTQLMDAVRPVFCDLNEKIKIAKSRRAELKASTPRKLHPGDRPDREERKAARKEKYRKLYPSWWNDASPQRRDKYRKRLTKQNSTDK